MRRWHLAAAREVEVAWADPVDRVAAKAITAAEVVAAAAEVVAALAAAAAERAPASATTSPSASRCRTCSTTRTWPRPTERCSPRSLASRRNSPADPTPPTLQFAATPCRLHSTSNLHRLHWIGCEILA